MRPSPDCRHEGGGARRLRVAFFAALAACAVALPVSDLAAQVSYECPDTEIASALDNYRLVMGCVSKGSPWRGARYGGQTEGSGIRPARFGGVLRTRPMIGADSLRSGAVGDNEHAELTARIEGGTKLSFWWKVDSQERADRLTFSAEPEIEAGTADGPSAPPSGYRGSHRWEARLDQG